MKTFFYITRVEENYTENTTQEQMFVEGVDGKPNPGIDEATKFATYPEAAEKVEVLIKTREVPEDCKHFYSIEKRFTQA